MNRISLTFVLALTMSPLSIHAEGATPTAQAPLLAPSAYRHHHYDAGRGHVYVLNDNRVLVARRSDGAVPVQASLFTHGAMPREQLVDTMLWMLEVTQANDAFLSWARRTMPRNPIFKKETFTAPLTDSDGTQHRFTLTQSAYNALYVLTYERVRP